MGPAGSGRVELKPGVLTDDDINRLLKAVDKAEAQRMEAIGYDISSPQARAEIHADHVFVRGLRKGSGRAKMAAVGAITVAILALIGQWIASGVVVAIHSAVSAKGAP